MNLYESISNELKRGNNNLPEVHSIIYQAVENIKDSLGKNYTVNETNNGLVQEGRPNTYNIFDENGAFALRIEVSSEDENYKFQLIHPDGAKLGYFNLSKDLDLNSSVSQVERILTKAIEKAGEEYNKNLDLEEGSSLKESMYSSVEGVTDAMYSGNVSKVLDLVKKSLGDTKEAAQEAFVDMYNMYAYNGSGPNTYVEALDLLMKEFPEATKNDERYAGIIAQDSGNKKFFGWDDFADYEFN